MFRAKIVVETLSFEEGSEEVKIPFLKIEAPSGSIMEPLTQKLVSSINSAAKSAEAHWLDYRDNVGEKAIAMMVEAARVPRQSLLSVEEAEEPASFIGPGRFAGSDYLEGEMF